MSESMDDEDSAYAQQQAVYYHQAHDLVSALYDAAIKYGRDKCHEEACEVADAMIAASTGVNVVQFDALCKVLVRALLLHRLITCHRSLHCMLCSKQ